MKTCFDHNFSKSTTAQFLQKASATATSHIHDRNKIAAKFDRKLLFSVIHSAPENGPHRSRISQKPLRLLILLIFITSKMKNVSCFMFHTLEGVRQTFDLLFLERRPCERRSFLQNWANRRFRWLMIKTSWPCFLIGNTVKSKLYEISWNFIKFRCEGPWSSILPYFHERSYEKTRTYKVRILSHLMRFYLKRGWNITRRPLCDGWNPYRLLAFFQIKSHQMV